MLPLCVDSSVVVLTTDVKIVEFEVSTNVVEYGLLDVAVVVTDDVSVPWSSR